MWLLQENLPAIVVVVYKQQITALGRNRKIQHSSHKFYPLIINTKGDDLKHLFFNASFMNLVCPSFSSRVCNFLLVCLFNVLTCAPDSGFSLCWCGLKSSVLCAISSSVKLYVFKGSEPSYIWIVKNIGKKNWFHPLWLFRLIYPLHNN